MRCLCVPPTVLISANPSRYDSISASPPLVAVARAQATAIVCCVPGSERLYGPHRPTQSDEGCKTVASTDERDVLKLYWTRLHRRYVCVCVCMCVRVSVKDQSRSLVLPHARSQTHSAHHPQRNPHLCRYGIGARSPGDEEVQRCRAFSVPWV